MSRITAPRSENAEETFLPDRRTFLKASIAVPLFASGCAASKNAGQPTLSQARALTEAEARAIVTPWYSLFTFRGRGDVRAVFDWVIAKDFQGLAGDLPGERRDREATIQLIEDFGQLIPDGTFEIKELFVSGDRVIVRGEATGTPAKEFFGVPPAGRRYQIMTIDILTVANGMITKTYHLENWLGALEQLRAGAR